MAIKTIYQTLEFRNNNTHIEVEGPFLCSRRDAWLGRGYYFWDTFIQNAHWWGETAYHQKYVICEATCDFDSQKCFDLCEPEYMVQFQQVADLIKKNTGAKSEEITVRRILEFMSRNVSEFDFEAIRINGSRDPSMRHERAKSLASGKFTFRFNAGRDEYFNTKPLIQICLLKKEQ